MTDIAEAIEMIRRPQSWVSGPGGYDRSAMELLGAAEVLADAVERLTREQLSCPECGGIETRRVRVSDDGPLWGCDRCCCTWVALTGTEQSQQGGAL